MTLRKTEYLKMKNKARTAILKSKGRMAQKAKRFERPLFGPNYIFIIKTEYLNQK